ncbi:MAG: DUF1080 domain-containing protein [Chloroflexi bacterium]|nr:DUF1080 domain-containing protein [Chloroflexota bacterium]
MKYLIVLCTVILLVGGCSPAGMEAWGDDFSTVTSEWQTESDASAEAGYYVGVMRILVKVPNRLAWVSNSRELSDFRVKVEATQVAGPNDNEYGLLVRMKDPSHFYRFSISGDGYYQVSKYDGSSWIPLSGDWAASDAIRTGIAVNQLEVTCQGSRMALIVNGQLLVEVEDKSYARGGIGLYAGSFFEPGVEVHFDNLQVSPP